MNGVDAYEENKLLADVAYSLSKLSKEELLNAFSNVSSRYILSRHSIEFIVGKLEKMGKFKRVSGINYRDMRGEILRVRPGILEFVR